MNLDCDTIYYCFACQNAGTRCYVKARDWSNTFDVIKYIPGSEILKYQNSGNKTSCETGGEKYLRPVTSAEEMLDI